jgi:hypothetical protein
MLVELRAIRPLQGELQKELSLSRSSSNMRLQAATALAIKYLGFNNLNQSFDIFFSNLVVKKVLGSYFGTKFGVGAKEFGFTRSFVNNIHRRVFTPKIFGRLYFNSTEK